MKRKIYIHTCVKCGFEWESTLEDEACCKMCLSGNIDTEEIDDEQD